MPARSSSAAPLDDIFYRSAHPYTLGLARRDAVAYVESRASPAADRRQPAGSVRTAGRLRLLRALPARDADLPQRNVRRRSPWVTAIASRCWLHHRIGAPSDRSTSRSRTSAVRVMNVLIERRQTDEALSDRPQPDRARARRRLARDRRARGRRTGRRERLRQVDVRQDAGRPARQDARHGAVSRRDAAAEVLADRFPAPRQAYADDLSGSVLVAESAHDGRRDHRRRAASATADDERRRFANASRTGCVASVSSPTTCRAIRTSSPAGSGSASASRAR